MKKILVVTIGTRDLMFQVSDGTWYNIGNDRQIDDIISEQNQVTESLGLDWNEYRSFRKLSHYLLQDIQNYGDRLKPTIWGQLFDELKDDLDKVYLIGTDQPQSVRQREKDTIHASHIVAYYLNSLGIEAEVVPFGQDGLNPSDFEEMFRWWQEVWETRIQVGERELILCVKGGVGQTSEAGRTSALSRYGERVSFYDAKENSSKNRRGISSDLIGPTFGTNYLWNRVQKQALGLLKNYNYLVVQELLEPYFQQDSKGWSSTPSLLEGAIAWNRGEFDTCFRYAKNYLEKSQVKREEPYLWQWRAYEQAYTAVIRLYQNNTTEAMLHSFRAVEGLIYEWIKEDLKNYIQYRDKEENSYPLLLKPILDAYPSAELKSVFKKFDEHNRGTIKISGEAQSALVKTIISGARSHLDFSAWDSEQARIARNRLSHRLGGISEKDLFRAWGEDIHDKKAWEKRLINCINLISGKSFSSFQKASVMPSIHHHIKNQIEVYQV